MKAIIEVDFKNINGADVNDDLLKKIPQLYNSTQKTVEILSEQIQKYFKDYKIKVNVTYKLR